MPSSHNNIASQPAEETPRFFISNGHIELVKELGQGGFGSVFLAHGTIGVGDPQYFAVKCLQRFDESHPQTQLQAQELSAHQAVCDHHNIVNFRDCDWDANFVYVIMDYCRGGDLHKTINDRRYLNDDELTKKVFVQLLDAVHHCHERGVFHRDLKPENVLCNNRRGDSIRLADFGLASTNPTGTSFGVGSKPYISPEAYSGTSAKPFCHRASDVWGLGLIFFNMITSGHPWDCASSTDEAFSKYTNDPNTLRRHLSNVTAATADLLLRILALDPSSRIQLPELREKILNLDSIYKKKPTRPPVPRKPLQLISPKRAGHPVQKKVAAKPAPVVAKLGKPAKDFVPVVEELMERLVIHAVVPAGDGVLIAVT